MQRHRLVVPVFVLVTTLFATGCAASADSGAAPDLATEMNPIAEAYVKLVLALGEHDAGYVDAYYGPAEWRTEEELRQRSLDEIREAAGLLLDALRALDVSDREELVQLRHRFLMRQLETVAAYTGILAGDTLPFDRESEALYDAVAPTLPESRFAAVLDRLDKRLPGEGPLLERLERFRQDFIIPEVRLDTVFKVAIAEARRRTLARIELPATEHFTVEYVENKPWSGYNWYKGGGHSVIQMNTDLPITIDRAIELAAHEGYPGHHVYNTLLEERLVKDRGWIEYAITPLFSPQSLIAEGSANYGIDVAFPGDERLAFLRDVLFPLAGLDPVRAAEYVAVQDLLDELSYAENEAARRYLNGEIDREEAAEWLARFSLVSLDHARRRVRFFDTYRSYVINYNLGHDLVKSFVERNGATTENMEARWTEFARLLSSPLVPSALREGLDTENVREGA